MDPVRLFRLLWRGMRHPATRFQLRIGYLFNTISLLEQALTHRSVTENPAGNLERLEFLGDAILGQVVSRELYRRFPLSTEGDLTQRRSSIVNKDYLAGVGLDLNLHHLLRVDSGVDLTNDKVQRNLVGDAMEALIGAIFLDGGLKPARRFIYRQILNRDKDINRITNHKGQLIEYCHNHGLPSPKFTLVRTKGPDHDKRFLIQAVIGDNLYPQAQAHNKKAAEQEAAYLALKSLQD